MRASMRVAVAALRGPLAARDAAALVWIGALHKNNGPPIMATPRCEPSWSRTCGKCAPRGLLLTAHDGAHRCDTTPTATSSRRSATILASGVAPRRRSLQGRALLAPLLDYTRRPFRPTTRVRGVVMPATPRFRRRHNHRGGCVRPMSRRHDVGALRRGVRPGSISVVSVCSRRLRHERADHESSPGRALRCEGAQALAFPGGLCAFHLRTRRASRAGPSHARVAADAAVFTKVLLRARRDAAPGGAREEIDAADRAKMEQTDLGELRRSPFRFESPRAHGPVNLRVCCSFRPGGRPGLDAMDRTPKGVVWSCRDFIGTRCGVPGGPPRRARAARGVGCRASPRRLRRHRQRGSAPARGSEPRA